MKKLKAVAGVLLFALAIVLIGHAVWNMGSSALLQKTLKEQEARGLPMSLAAVAPPPVGPEDNAAPLLDQAFTVLHRVKPDALLNLDASGDAPSKTSFPLEELDIVQRARLSELVNSPVLAPAFASLEGAATKPACNFGLDYAKGSTLRLPHLAYQRKAIRLMGLRAWIRADERQADGALDDILVAFRLGRHLEREPLMLAHLVYIACDATSSARLNAVLRKLPTDALPTARLDDILAELDRHLSPELDGAVLAVDGERIVFGKWLFERAILGKLKPEDVAKLGIAETPALFLSFLWRPFLKSDYRHYLLGMEKARAAVQPPYTEASAIDVAAGLPRFCVLSRRVAPGVAGFAQKVAEHRVHLRLSRLGLQLVQHLQSSGQYPNALAELGVSDELVTDPFTGNILVYRKTDKGFTLYSLGPNRTDDGGKAFGADGKPADLVWEM